MKKILLVLIAAAFATSGSGLLMAQTNKPCVPSAYAVCGDKIVGPSPKKTTTYRPFTDLGSFSTTYED